MNKILLIIQREYLTRVRKKSFWIASIIVPFLIAGIYAIPIYFALNSNDTKTIQIADESGLFKDKIKSEKDITYKFVNQPFEEAKKGLLKSDADILVSIPKDILSNSEGVKMVGKESIGFSIQHDIEGAIQTELRNIKLKNANIDLKVLEDNKVSINSETYTLKEDGQEQSSSSTGAGILGGIFGFILYMSAFLYGSQVMNGVIEEKSNRIIEVMISSVRPFQLMMGKIIGVGLVGITQFLLWGVLTFAASTATTSLMSGKMEAKVQAMQKSGAGKEDVEKLKKDIGSKNPLSAISQTVENVSLAKIIICFLLFYIGGYLIYSSLFAAVGAAVENATEAQQFLLPVTIPIIISFLLVTAIIENPDGDLAFWASMFPLTSPIDMMIRLPFGVPNWQIALSFSLLVLGFMGTTWLAGKIYRVGILMYGKKPSWKEIAKWVLYKG
jgi:ABC-2 type transport system permease protein